MVKKKAPVVRSAHDQKRGNALLLVAIDEPRCDGADVVQVQMRRRMTSRRDWKLKRAGWDICQFETNQNGDVNEEMRRRTMGAPEY